MNNNTNNLNVQVGVKYLCIKTCREKGVLFKKGKAYELTIIFPSGLIFCGEGNWTVGFEPERVEMFFDLNHTNSILTIKQWKNKNENN